MTPWRLAVSVFLPCLLPVLLHGCHAPGAHGRAMHQGLVLTSTHY